ncbi:MAG: ABC transporter permease [Candidatus Coatesbacteria bacterium]|nr:MAG: ABC transporter permease [Candidatus Coatesbacteria bacterium]
MLTPDMGSLVISNLYRRKVRSAIAIVAVAVGVAAPIVLAGMTYGSINEVLDRIRNVGADIIVSRTSNPALLGVRTGVLDESLAVKLGTVEVEYDGEIVRPAESVSPVLVWVAEFDGRLQNVYGITPDEFPAFGGPMADALVAGRLMDGPDELVIDDRLAASAGLGNGDTVELMNRKFTIAGVVRAGAGARLFMRLDALQGLTGQNGKVSAFYVKCKHPGYVSVTASAIENEFPGLNAIAMGALADEMAEGMAGLDEFVGAVTALALLVAGLVILLTTYTVVLERTREIGILKALGASRAFIARVILSETLVLCVLVAAVGVGLAFLANLAIEFRYPLLTVETTPGRVFGYAALGVAVGVLAGIVPVLYAATRDPAETLRYE